jgi:hypothetical protein
MERVMDDFDKLPIFERKSIEMDDDRET